MHKKLARKIRQQRNKRIDRNVRFQNRMQRRRKALAAFKVSIVENENISNEYVAALAKNQKCFFCDEEITDLEVVSSGYIALETKSAQNFYFVHRRHIYDQDGVTPLPEMQKNLTDIYLKIFEKEKGHLFKNLNARGEENL